MNTKQTGHEQNVVNLGLIIAKVSSFQSGYNPSRVDFSIPNLTQLKTNGESVIASWSAADNVFKKAISERNYLFTGFDSLITRTINALRISGASEQTINQAEVFVRDLRGGRASDKPKEEDLAEDKENGGEGRQITLHNSTIDSKIENFRKYVLFLSMVDQYNPNEEDLTINALTNKLAVLKTANDNYNSAEAALDASRWQRNLLLYTPISGVYDIASGVKLYVKSAFGASSPEYKSISNINFTRPR